MEVTEYLRKALTAQMRLRMDFKNGDFFIKIARKKMEQGKITSVDASQLF